MEGKNAAEIKTSFGSNSAIANQGSPESSCGPAGCVCTDLDVIRDHLVAAIHLLSQVSRYWARPKRVNLRVLRRRNPLGNKDLAKRPCRFSYLCRNLTNVEASNRGAKRWCLPGNAPQR
jgi:hypothetical protein